MKHFVFGYGSLICPQSRAITAPTLRNAVAEPVVVENIDRVWSARCRARTDAQDETSRAASKARDHIRGWTPMGVRIRCGSRCNGVLIHVDDEELRRFDVREAGYVRRRIELAHVHRHVESEKLLSESLPLWPESSTDRDGSRREELAEDLRCPECRLVFEQGAEQRRRARSSAGAHTSPQKSEDIAVWVYVQSEK